MVMKGTHINRRWSVAEAKARLSEVVHEAGKEPQVIENRGREVAVVLGIDEYDRLRAIESEAAPRTRWAEFLRHSEQLRSEGGAELVESVREPRPSPFEDERDD